MPLWFYKCDKQPYILDLKLDLSWACCAMVNRLCAAVVSHKACQRQYASHI